MRVPFERVPGWVTRYDAAHPDTRWVVEPHHARAHSPDGSLVELAVPFVRLVDLSLDGLAAHLLRPWRIGVVLVRKGGFAVARLEGAVVGESKIGRRHVQSRTKAGGWSQQRFARRRDNQARAAFDAAADHAARLLTGRARPLDLLGVGGDRQAVNAVLAHPELAGLRTLPQTWLGGLPDPTRTVLDSAVVAVRSVEITLVDPD